MYVQCTYQAVCRSSSLIQYPYNMFVYTEDSKWKFSVLALVDMIGKQVTCNLELSHILFHNK
jgi:hypothetical protein